MKRVSSILLFLTLSFTIFATEDSLFDFDSAFDEDSLFSDDALFGGDDLFGDDAFFGDDGIIELDVTEKKDSSTSDLSKGVLFQDGSVKISGNFDTSLSTTSVLYKHYEEEADKKSFGEQLKETTLTPSVNATLSVDARPNQNLRMYTKFGISYPYTSQISLGLNTNPSIKDWFTVKELFTDFSVADRVFFRFGLHTVSWGTGYFYSPVSDMINTSSIDPENVDADISGALNLRTQVTFPGTQNCLWFYLIPSTEISNSLTAATYLRDTALAGKAEFVFGGYEIGTGAFLKYQGAPKLMTTFSGPLFKSNIFGEVVYQYGANSEWQAEPDKWTDKTNIFQFTAGATYMWKTPSILLAGQYYYNGNTKDKLYDQTQNILGSTVTIKIPNITEGHNIALVANFGKIHGNSDLTATVFGMVNWGRSEMVVDIPSDLIPESYESQIKDLKSMLSQAIFSAMINYKPISQVTLGIGPYITFADFDNPPVVALKLSAKLGGGKF